VIYTKSYAVVLFFNFIYNNL